MTVIRPNSISGISSITAQSSTVEFYDPAGNTITLEANVNGNVVGNVTGNVVGNVTGNLTGNADTATTATSATTATTATTATNALGITTTQITVGNSFIKDEAVGLGTTTTTGRDAGISTAAGTMIYIPDTGMQVYAGDTRGWRTVASTDDNFVSEITGGTKTTVGSRTYHTFTSSGTLTVQNMSKTANFLVVAGGGAGGNWAQGGAGGNGGGGAGGVVAGNALPLAHGSYTITVGAGGALTGANPAGPTPLAQYNGANSTIANPTITTITAKGGGAGGNDGTDGDGAPGHAQPGGSGGGTNGSVPGYQYPGSATQPGTNSLYGATDYGNAGGQGLPSSPYNAGGGGGAGGAGGNANPSLAGTGGTGQPFDLTFTPTDNGTPGPAPGRYFGGGGGGTGYNDNNTQNSGGAGGGSPGHMPGDPGPVNGTANTGGGGGGGRTHEGGTSITMNGGSGIVIISYT